MKNRTLASPRIRIEAGPSASAALDVAVGERLREARKRRGVTLAELAAASDRSVGYLSQIERGMSSPTLREVASLAGVVGVDFLDLISEPLLAEQPCPVRRRGDQRSVPFRGSGITKRVLAPANTGRIRFYGMRIRPGGSTGDAPYAHDGEEAGVVLSGSIALKIGGEEYRLGAGDSFRFSSALPHAFRNAGRTTAEVVWINVGGSGGAPGE